MSKPHYRWWSYAKNIIRAYPDRCAELSELHSQAVIAAYGGTTHSNGISRTVETLAMRELPRTEQREYESVRSAIAKTLNSKSGGEKIELVKSVFWDGARLDAAAHRAHTSERTARRWHRNFITLVGIEFGLTDDDDLEVKNFLKP